MHLVICYCNTKPPAKGQHDHERRKPISCLIDRAADLIVAPSLVKNGVLRHANGEHL
jgi:hypothetical protein